VTRQDPEGRACSVRPNSGSAYRITSNAPGPLATEPAIPGHGVRMQHPQPLLALARSRSGRRISLGVCRSSGLDPGRLQQIRLGQPPGIVGWCPPGPGLLPSGRS